jgi:hypothetical protein
MILDTLSPLKPPRPLGFYTHAPMVTDCLRDPGQDS